MHPLPSRRRGYVSLIAGIVVTFILGASYAYSVYKGSLEAMWGSSFYAVLPFSVFIASFAFTSILGGRFYRTRGARLTVLISILLVAIGLKLSSLVVRIFNPLFMVFSYGALVGLGNGFGYVPVIALARRWFPDRAGFATGAVIFGYGGGAIVFAPLKTYLLLNYGLTVMFIAVGAVSLLLGILAVVLIKDPDPSITKAYSIFAKRRAVLPKVDLNPGNVVKTIDFWIMWVSYALVSGAGLMLIGHLFRFCELRGLGKTESALAVSVFSLMNAIGRPPAGWVSDKLGKFGRPVTMTIMFTAQSLLFIALAYVGRSVAELYVLIALAGFMYGSALALYPALTGDFYGLKYLSENYALVFTAWGVAGLVFPSIGGYLKDLTGGYEHPLIIFSIASLTGSLMCLYLKRRLVKYVD